MIVLTKLVNYALITTTGLSRSNSTLMTEVQGIKTKTCNYNMDPYPLDVWGATGGKNSEDI